MDGSKHLQWFSQSFCNSAFLSGSFSSHSIQGTFSCWQQSSHRITKYLKSLLGTKKSWKLGDVVRLEKQVQVDVCLSDRMDKEADSLLWLKWWWGSVWIFITYFSTYWFCFCDNICQSESVHPSLTKYWFLAVLDVG